MEYITYEMFGAVGDGITDDMPAIVKAHEAANRQNMLVRAKEGAVYYLSPADRTALVQTSTDWTGARFVMDDVNCENYQSPLFLVASKLEPVDFPVETLAAGQSQIPNPTGKPLYLLLFNDGHNDYIRRGLNQSNGEARRDNVLLDGDGNLSSPVSFPFEQVTRTEAYPVDDTLLTLQGGEFVTLANQADSRYNYHARNIVIRRSRVEVSNIRHTVQGEGEHGAPYRGFISVQRSAYVFIHDCVFTGHKTYWTIGSANLPVPMGSYDIDLNASTQVTIARCSQTNDIMDSTYWGLIGTNFCRELVLEDCVFSRFDAHCGVTDCTLRRCKLGHQCLNAIGFGTFIVEDTEACGNALVNLREDYGSTWRGDLIIRNCIWRPLGASRSVFSAHNDGTHYFGYPCYLPANVTIDGLTVIENEAAPADVPLTIFNHYLGTEQAEERPFLPQEPMQVTVRNVHTGRDIRLCADQERMKETAFHVE